MPQWLFWLLAGVLLDIIEILTSGFVVACFSIGCFSAAILAALDYSLIIQIVTFCAVSFLVFIFARPIFIEWMGKRGHKVETNTERLIGMNAMTQNEVSEFGGSVKIEDEIWRSQTESGQTLAAGTKVRVVRIEGNKLIVRIDDKQ